MKKVFLSVCLFANVIAAVASEVEECNVEVSANVEMESSNCSVEETILIGEGCKYITGCGTEGYTVNATLFDGDTMELSKYLYELGIIECGKETTVSYECNNQ